MRVLLDTHTFLWWLSNDARLGRKARERIADRSNEVLLSVASVWELTIKSAMGRFDVKTDFEAWLLAQLATNRFEILPILLPHVLALSRLPDHHRDPFDRILIAQATSEKVPLLTADTYMKHYPVEVVW